MHALIGYTGFVGSSLATTRKYDRYYNSTNIAEIEGLEFESITCAGVSAVKWLANREPDKDQASIDLLKKSLQKVSCQRFVLISTVDVYPEPFGVNENDLPDLSESQPYGKHRRLLELWTTEQFEKVQIVRLPGLFGPGLKKNVIFDLLNKNQLHNIDANSSFQWYPVHRLGFDLNSIIEADIDLINISVAPIRTQTIIDRFFPAIRLCSLQGNSIKYDVRTLHPKVLSSNEEYHLSINDVLRELQSYISASS